MIYVGRTYQSTDEKSVASILDQREYVLSGYMSQGVRIIVESCALMMTEMPWSHVLNMQSGLTAKKMFSRQRLSMVVLLVVGLQTSMALPSITSLYSVCQSISAGESM